MPLIKGHSKQAISTVAYVAGLFDGEGSISASASPNCKKNIRIMVAIGMCDYDALLFVANAFGGKIRTEKRKTKSGKLVYTWSLYCRKAAEFLTTVLPYLIIKKKRAHDAILLAAMMRTRKKQRVVINAAEISRRTKIAARIKNANIDANGRVALYAVN